MSGKPFGTHRILDADDYQGKLNDKKHIQSIIDTLVEEMGMKKVGETIFEYFEDNEYNRERER